jgi:PadR family transcriptional regulator PadR
VSVHAACRQRRSPERLRAYRHLPTPVGTICFQHMSAGNLPKAPVRGWVRPGGRRGRWIEPFVLMVLAEGPIHGYSVISQLNQLGLNADGVDVGMVYRTLREFEAEGLVTTKWGLEEGPPRREYRLTSKGHEVLDEWVEVMVERRRLIEAFVERIRPLPRPRGV